MMANKSPQLKPVRLCSYAVASGDMYYAEMEQRDIYAWDDPQRGFRVWGELRGGGPATAVDLCQMLLEYAMYLRSWCREPEARYNMQDFGERLGHALASLLKQSPPVRMDTNPGACALMCVLESMNVQITIEQVGPELHFLLAECPLVEVARRTGLREVELAHAGVNALCQSLAHAIDPGLQITIPLLGRGELVYSLTHAA